MDTEHERKFSKMIELWRTLTPAGLTSRRLVWQMDTEMVVALLKDAELFKDRNTVRFVNPASGLPSDGIECLGIPVEIITKDEVNLVIKVV